MSFPFKDRLFNAQWLRTAGHAYAGGADLGECLAAAAEIGPKREYRLPDPRGLRRNPKPQRVVC